MKSLFAAVSVTAVALLAPCLAAAEIANIKVVTDANPDYNDLPSLVHSVTDNWKTPAEKCWAMYYWNHIARRQTNPMMLHGNPLTDPIRQFNDYGFTMCSTITGINQAIWEQMGLKHKYWDISNHTVSEVFYDDKWHMYDNSLSAIYTLDDGKTIAGVEDIGKEQAGPKSDGKPEKGYIAIHNCLNATSNTPDGFLTGCDTMRPLSQIVTDFSPKGLKYRYYYYDWDSGHRYILNLKPGETYTRTYHSLGDSPEFYVPNDNGKDPEEKNPRYHIRGNGVWDFKPPLTAADYKNVIHSAQNIAPLPSDGLATEKIGEPAEVIFKIQSANVTTSQVINAAFFRKSADDQAKLSVSTDNGLHWKEVWTADAVGEINAKVPLVEPVNGAYEVLVKADLFAKSAPADATLRSIDIQTTTEINSKTQPRLNLGANTIYVGTGNQTESVVFWPELQGNKYKQHIVEESGIACAEKNPEYMGSLYQAEAGKEAYIVYRLDAPNDFTHLTYGGRFYNRSPKAHIDLLYSLDGKTWTPGWSLTSIEKPWDVIHYENVEIPAGHRSVYVKYVMNSPGAGTGECSIYAVRMEGDYKLNDATFKPMEVTFNWNEMQEDYKTVARSHTQLIEKVPFKYTINVGGVDHPKMESMTVNLKGSRPDVKYGYSDGKDAGGEKFVGKWVEWGKNLAVGKSYTYSVEPDGNYKGTDPDHKKLTDGTVGPTYTGGASYMSGAAWNQNRNPVVTVDLGAPTACATLGLNFHGYKSTNPLEGDVDDKVEVLCSDDGKTFTSAGFLQTNLRWKDMPVNFMVPDEETLNGNTFRLVPQKPITTRYVQFKVQSERIFCATEIEILDSMKLTPFDLRIALPADAATASAAAR